MLNSRNLIGWLLLGLLAAVGAGGAILGVSQSPGTASLQVAITNTVNATSYSEVFTEHMASASETGYLTYQAPNRLGGYVEAAGRRTYIYIDGNTEYQSLTVSNGTSTAHLVFYRQHSQTPVVSLDPAQNYLRLGRLHLRLGRLAPHVHRSGNTYSFSLTQGGETGTLAYTVSGQYVGILTIHAQDTAVEVTISQVGSAPSIGLPKGARVVTPPASGVLG